MLNLQTGSDWWKRHQRGTIFFPPTVFIWQRKEEKLADCGLKESVFVLLSRHFVRGNCVPAGGTPWPWGDPGVRSALGPNGHKSVCQTPVLFPEIDGFLFLSPRGSIGQSSVETGNGPAPGTRHGVRCDVLLSYFTSVLPCLCFGG